MRSQRVATNGDRRTANTSIFGTTTIGRTLNVNNIYYALIFRIGSVFVGNKRSGFIASKGSDVSFDISCYCGLLPSAFVTPRMSYGRRDCQRTEFRPRGTKTTTSISGGTVFIAVGSIFNGDRGQYVQQVERIDQENRRRKANKHVNTRKTMSLNESSRSGVVNQRKEAIFLDFARY